MKQLKITELRKVPKDKIGYLNTNNVILQPNEKTTFKYLTLFGLNIEIIQPTLTENAKNPDALIFGIIWEAKTPTRYNPNTIKQRFRTASKQAANVIFDFRLIKQNSDDAEKCIIAMFEEGRRVRRLIVIEKSGKVLDIRK